MRFGVCHNLDEIEAKLRAAQGMKRSEWGQKKIWILIHSSDTPTPCRLLQIASSMI